MEQLRTLKAQVDAAYMATLADTIVDPRRDGVFGIAAYAVRLLHELIRPGMSTSVGARMSLRTLAEMAITLSYLAMRDEDDKWMTATMELDRRSLRSSSKRASKSQASRPSRHLSRWRMKIAGWSSPRSNWATGTRRTFGGWPSPRRRSDIDDLDDDWTSHHSHGHWGAVRESCFRSVRKPAASVSPGAGAELTPLGDVLPDAARVVDRTTSTVNGCYPDAKIDRLVADGDPEAGAPAELAT